MRINKFLSGQMLVLAASISLACLGNPARAADLSPLDQLRERMAALAKTPLSAEQSADALMRYGKKLSFILTDPAFARLTGKEQHDALYAAAVLALRLGNQEDALKRIVAVSEMPEGNGRDWELRYRIAMAQSVRPEVKKCILTLANRYPGTLRQVDPAFVDRTVSFVLSNRAEDAVALQMPLFEAQYLAYGLLEPSARWRDLSKELLKRGDLAGGQRVAARITDAEALIWISSELSTESLLARNPYRADPHAALAKELESAHELWRLHPRSGYVLQVLLRVLNLAGRFQEALDVSDGVVAKLNAKTSDAPNFDESYSLGWFYNDRANSYLGLGRWEDGVRALEEGSRQPEYNGPNVSQVLNLAGLYCQLGRPKEILATIQRVGDASAYGDGVRLGAEHCADFLVGEKKKSAKVLGRLDFARSSAPMILVNALVRENDLDRAASVMMEGLENEKFRSDILRRIQYIESGDADTELDSLWGPRRKQLYERADVSAAIGKYGYIRHYDLRQ